MQWTRYNVLDIEEAVGRRGRYVLTHTWDDVSQLFLNGENIRDKYGKSHQSNRAFAEKYDLAARD